MTINYEPTRQGLTVNPPLRDEATGEYIEGTEQVVDTRFVAFTKDEEPAEVDPDLMDEINSDDPEHPDYVSEEVRLAETFDEINTTEYEYSEDIANQIAATDIGTSPEATVVKYLASQVYLDKMSPEEAFQTAVESGLNPDKLMQQYYQLKQHF